MDQIASKFLKYAVTGGVAAIVDVIGFMFLIDLQLNVLIAGAASFSVAALVNYCLTSQFVFSRAASPRGFVMFLLVALLGLGINVGITTAGVFLLGVRPVVAKVFGIGAAFLINFSLNLFYVFRPKASAVQRAIV
jgi:putative flippase GtrA